MWSVFLHRLIRSWRPASSSCERARRDARRWARLRYMIIIMSVYKLSCRHWRELVHNGLCFISGAEGETGWSFIQETRAAAERFHSSEREGSCEEEQTRYSTCMTQSLTIQYTSRNMRQASIYILMHHKNTSWYVFETAANVWVWSPDLVLYYNN